MTNLNSHSPNVRQLSVDILNQVENHGAYADDLLEKTFSQQRLQQNDRALLVELVNGTLRQRGHLDWILAQLYHGGLRTMPAKLKQILRLSIYQIKFLDKVPEYAAVSEGVQLAKKSGGVAWGRLANGLLRNYLRKRNQTTFPLLAQDKVVAISTFHSHPEWLVERWLGRYGESNTLKYCEYNNRRPTLALRVNSGKNGRQALAEKLKAMGIEVQLSSYLSDFLRVQKPKDLMNTQIFRDGHFAIQDESTALPSILLDPMEGDRIIDMCAAPGGKTCHIARLANDRAMVFAVDISGSRLRRLSENAARLGLHSIELIESDATKISLPNVNKILLDAPCSGLGVLSKRSDLRWRRQPEDINKIQEVQRRLLRKAAELLAPGGVLIYSTCTLEPEETELLIEDFLRQHVDCEIDAAFCPSISGIESDGGFWRTLPFLHDMDGSFSVRIIKHK